MSRTGKQRARREAYYVDTGMLWPHDRERRWRPVGGGEHRSDQRNSAVKALTSNLEHAKATGAYRQLERPLWVRESRLFGLRRAIVQSFGKERGCSREGLIFKRTIGKLSIAQADRMRTRHGSRLALGYSIGRWG